MNCQRFDEIVDLLAARELEPSAAAEAEAHAGQCPECAGRLDAAWARLRTLEASLGTLSLSDGFIERVMAGVRAEAARAQKPAEAPSQERWRTRVLRYAAYAAAASLFIMAGYGFLHRPDAARFRSGNASLVGVNSAQLAPDTRLAAGQVVATPANATGMGRLDMAEGRLQAVLAPGSLLRLADPRSGVFATLDRGDLFWRAAGQHAAAFATPLARVRTGPGDFSIHVAPTQGEGEPGRFTGRVTIVTRNGSASVQVVGQEQGPLTLSPGHVLTLRSDPHRLVAQPLPFEAVEQSLLSQIQEFQANRGNFQRLWQEISDAVTTAPTQQRSDLFRRAVGYQEAIRQADQAAAERARLLEALRHAHEQGNHIFRVVLEPAPDQP